MLGSVDPFDFVLAEGLGQPLSAVRDMPNADIVAWRAFYRWRSEMAKLEEKHNG
jgi:hypothetical protein